jgi:hypothetical protein
MAISVMATSMSDPDGVAFKLGKNGKEQFAEALNTATTLLSSTKAAPTLQGAKGDAIITAAERELKNRNEAAVDMQR